MIGLIWNLSFGEIFVVGALAVMVFGGRLPEVAARVVHAVKRFRRSLDDLKRETGIEQELRNIDYEIRQAERAAHAPASSPKSGPQGLPSSSGSSESAPVIEAPPGFRQARRIQGISPDLAPGATALAGGEDERSGLVTPRTESDASAGSPAPDSPTIPGAGPSVPEQGSESPPEEEAQTQEKDSPKGSTPKTPGPG